MKVNVEVPANSDLDESDGELIVVIFALLRMFQLSAKNHLFINMVQEVAGYVSLLVITSGDYVNGANKYNIKYCVRVPLYFIQVCRLVQEFFSLCMCVCACAKQFFLGSVQKH